MARRIDGFSLIELLIALCVAGLLLTFAVNSFSDAAMATRTAQIRGALHMDLLAAQREALLRREHVVLCASDGVACDRDVEWEHGWIGFVDTDHDREHQPSETLVLSEKALSNGIRVRSSKQRTRLVFQPASGGNGGSNVTFVICAGSDRARASTLVLSNDGRLRQGKPTAQRYASSCE